MKSSRGFAYVVGVCLLGIGVATAVTNPGQASYEAYATRRLTAYLQDEVCPKAGILEDTCSSALVDNQAQIRQFVGRNTERQNFVFWSIYQTELSLGDALPSIVSDLVPSYYFESVGIFSSFYTYKAERID